MAHQALRILIADHHDATRRGVREIVESSPDYRIIAEAADGRTALRVACETVPDIAILEQLLPELNGLDLAHLLKRTFPNIEILLLTAQDNHEFFGDVLEAGVRSIVQKSDTDSHLLPALRALANHRPYFYGEISQTLVTDFMENRPHRGAHSLTHREREIVQQIAEGRINREMAERLHISIKTVETHRARAMHKLKLRTTADLVRFAIRNNIIQP